MQGKITIADMVLAAGTAAVAAVDNTAAVGTVAPGIAAA